MSEKPNLLPSRRGVGERWQHTVGSGKAPASRSPWVGEGCGELMGFPVPKGAMLPPKEQSVAGSGGFLVKLLGFSPGLSRAGSAVVR